MGLRKLLRARLRAQALKNKVPLSDKTPSSDKVPLSLQLLFPSAVGLSAETLERMLRELHPPLARARVEIFTGNLGAGMEQRVQVHWDRHTVLVSLRNSPMPEQAVDQAVELAHYEPELKDRAWEHAAHALLVYEGNEQAPLEQYRALALIAAALVPLGAIVALNVNAHTSYPAQNLLPLPGEDMNEVLRTLPLLALFVGFVMLQVDGTEGLWIRTCGAPLIDLADLALHVRGNDEESKSTWLLFKHIFTAQLEERIRFGPGDTVEDETLLWRFRTPRAHEGFLVSPRMLVLEPRKG